MFKKLKIGAKLMIGFLIAALLAIVFFGLLVLKSSQDVLEKEAYEKIHLISESKQVLLIQLLTTQIANLQVLAINDHNIDLTKKMLNINGNLSEIEQEKAYTNLKRDLTEFADFYGGPGLKGGTYTDIMVFDLNGLARIATYGPDEGEIEFDMPWFKEGSTKIYLGGIAYNPVMRQTTQIAAMPMRDENGDIIAVLQLETNIRSINDLLNGGETLGETGEIYLVNEVNEDKIMITAPRFNPELQGKQKVDTALINEALKTGNHVEMRYEGYRGDINLGVAEKFPAEDLPKINDERIGQLLENLGWVLVAEIDEKEAFKSSIELRNKVLLYGIFIVFLMVSLIGLFVYHYISNPIKKLSKVTQKISGGNYNVQAEVKSEDEIGMLARSFNEMAKKLSLEMSEAKRLPENVLRSMKDSLFVVNREGNITEANQAALEMLGYKRKELIGKPLSKVFSNTDIKEKTHSDQVESENMNAIKDIPDPNQNDAEAKFTNIEGRDFG